MFFGWIADVQQAPAMLLCQLKISSILHSRQPGIYRTALTQRSCRQACGVCSGPWAVIDPQAWAFHVVTADKCFAWLTSLAIICRQVRAEMPPVTSLQGTGVS